MRFVLSVYLLLSFFSLSSMPVQEPIKGLLVQFSRAMDVAQISEDCNGKFVKIQSLNPEKTIFLFSYDIRFLRTEDAESLVESMPYFVLHQEDTKIEFRSTVPNDSLYPNQWHLPLIKADLAWDFTRSGVNRRGDTIVIAVVDDGLHLNHPDFQGNFWVNYADSLDNGIDDDSNGYIDDRYGWNFIGVNNDISDSTYYKGKHGTPVAGIIGARCNNVTGVSGIMWNVKLMIVNVTDTARFPNPYQSHVIQAYSYILNQRKLYNESNGAKGAFVVAINSSWGVDRKQPSQAPLWCAFYDTLGKYGILSVGAVTNAEELTDTYGDLPTLCPSDHLITVGNSTRFDNFANGGYSPISVDLSAPGSNVFSTNNYIKSNILTNNLYRDGFSGSSFSAPMVTAAIGVIHSYACEKLLDSIRINPAKANLLIRRMILEGVDAVPALLGKSVTGGRLNIAQSLKVLDEYCRGELSISKVQTQAQVEIYPNPGNGDIQIDSKEEIVEIKVFDSQGRLVQSNFKGDVLQLEGAESGVYFVHIQTVFGSRVLKYIKV